MDTKEIYKILDRYIRLNHNSVAEFGRKNEIGTRSKTHDFLYTLKNCNSKNSFNRICRLMEKLGFRVAVLDKNGNEIIIDNHFF